MLYGAKSSPSRTNHQEERKAPAEAFSFSVNDSMEIRRTLIDGRQRHSGGRKCAHVSSMKHHCTQRLWGISGAFHLIASEVDRLLWGRCNVHLFLRKCGMGWKLSRYTESKWAGYRQGYSDVQGIEPTKQCIKF